MTAPWHVLASGPAGAGVAPAGAVEVKQPEAPLWTGVITALLYLPASVDSVLRGLEARARREVGVSRLTPDHLIT